jgi:hypothetical protein
VLIYDTSFAVLIAELDRRTQEKDDVVHKFRRSAAILIRNHGVVNSFLGRVVILHLPHLDVFVTGSNPFELVERD